MTEKIERETRSIRRQHLALSQPISQFEILDPLAEPRGLRVGRGSRFAFPHEGIGDAILNLAQSVWHFKDYLIDASGKRKRVEDYAASKLGLLICSDLANEKKHATLKRLKGRSGLAPQLGILSDDKPMYSVIESDLRNNGVVEFAYNGKTKSHRFWVSRPVGIPFRTDILVARKRGVGSKGDAVKFVFKAFMQWQQLMKQLGVAPRSEHVD
ncbi:MAG: hypothetical protein KKB50_18045 [Planctomycetes bacterium]|nr:hypothetical protein [Planctomycetota bacterium]